MPVASRNRKTRIALLSLLSNVGLSTLKLAVGLITGAVSIVSEAIHSAMDLLASIVAFLAVRRSDAAPDAEHPYGHGKIENVSGALEAVLILAASLIIVTESIQKMLNPHQISNILIGASVMVVSGVINLIVSNRLYKVANEEDSIALAADALHLRADVITSFGVAAGLLIIRGANFVNIDLWFLDPFVAIALAVFIGREAIPMLIRAYKPLIDTSLPAAEHDIIIMAISRHRPASSFCEPYHQLRTRKAGKLRHIDFHLTMPGTMTVNEAHDICDRIEQEIETGLPNTIVLIHVEPEGHN